MLPAGNLYIIKPANPFDEEMGFIHQSFEDGLANFGILQAFRKSSIPALWQVLLPSAGNCVFRFVGRRSRAYRQHPCLGTCFLVATYGYFFQHDNWRLPGQGHNNFFFGGLLHDHGRTFDKGHYLARQAIHSKFCPKLSSNTKSPELERRILNPLKRDGFEDLSHSLRYHLGLDVGSEFQDCYFRDSERPYL